MNNELVQKVDYQNYRLEVYFDDAAFNPRIDFDTQTTIVASHGRYLIGDKQGKSQLEVWQLIADDVLPSLDYEGLNLTAKQIEKKVSPLLYYLPVFLLDHGDVMLQTTPFNDSWDSGQVGVIYIAREVAQKEWGIAAGLKTKPFQVFSRLKADLEEYNYFFKGEVYFYRMLQYGTPVEEDCDSRDGVVGEEIEVCGGYYGLDHLKAAIRDTYSFGSQLIKHL